ncbi:hypothetical protein BaRGS_00038383 [Batillaria attramentaria]|uniref:ZP domain-containing protein n=1 Tax=Batillaria attramentaria TaxID=370345 RepID=A0ABD0J655_9CAEN
MKASWPQTVELKGDMCLKAGMHFSSSTLSANSCRHNAVTDSVPAESDSVKMTVLFRRHVRQVPRDGDDTSPIPSSSILHSSTSFYLSIDNTTCGVTRTNNTRVEKLCGQGWGNKHQLLTDGNQFTPGQTDTVSMCRH